MSGVARPFLLALAVAASSCASAPTTQDDARSTPATLAVAQCGKTSGSAHRCDPLVDPLLAAAQTVKPTIAKVTRPHARTLAPSLARLEVTPTPDLTEALAVVAKTLRDLEHLVVTVSPAEADTVALTIDAQFATYGAASRLALNARWGGRVIIATHRHLGLRAITTRADNGRLWIDATVTRDAVRDWLGRFQPPASLRR